MPGKILPVTGLAPSRMDYVATSVYQGRRPVADDALVSLNRDEDGPVWARREALAQNPPRNIPESRPLREFVGLAAPLLTMLGGAVWGGWAGLGGSLLLFSVGMGIPPMLGFAPSLAFVLGLMLAVSLAFGCEGRFRCVFLGTKQGWSGYGQCALPVFGLMTLLSFLALSHTFTPPNGLGVFGGKAKLFYLAQGVPHDFFTDTAWEVLQPAYPPGFALVTLGCYGLAGGCGEWLTQLLPCLFSALACLLMGIRFIEGGASRSAVLWVVATFLGFQSLWVASLYYAESLLLLFLLTGVDAILKKPRAALGWMLVGGCGWVKNEGVLFLPLLWGISRWIEGEAHAPLRGLLFGIALPAGWLAWSRFHGATLYDYAPLYCPDFRQMGEAAAETFRLGFVEPWRYGFAFPLACLAPLSRTYRTRSMLVAILVMAGYTAATWWILGISRASDFEWHLRSLERLLWPPAMLFLFCAGRGRFARQMAFSRTDKEVWA